jgi:hypothetical protein
VQLIQLGRLDSAGTKRTGGARQVGPVLAGADDICLQACVDVDAQVATALSRRCVKSGVSPVLGVRLDPRNKRRFRIYLPRVIETSPDRVDGRSPAWTRW